jgi:allophanate hydrolase
MDWGELSRSERDAAYDNGKAVADAASYRRRHDGALDSGYGDPIAMAEAAIAADHAHADPAMWITRVPDEAIRAAAAALTAAGPAGKLLWGVPFAVKDNIDVAGMPTTAACPDFSYVAARSAPAVQRLLDAGALLVGKTNLDQFATGLVGVRSPYGIPRNVFDAGLVPGGSSSGSGVAVASGVVAFALGTDTAGSGRVPAAFGNIVGLKPTLGSVSTVGMVPACRSIDTISIFAQSVDAALAVQRIIAGYDAADPYSRKLPAGYLRRAAVPEGFCLGYADVGGMCDPAEQAIYEAVCGGFARRAAVDLAPFLRIAQLLYDGPWVAERTAALRDFVRTKPESLHPVTRLILEGGFDRLTVDAFDSFDLLAHARRRAEEIFAQVDALLLPTTPFCPTLAELAADGITPNSRLGRFTNFANLCDLAVIAVPGGFSPEGLPVGVMLVGPAWSEGRLAGVADRLHRAATDRVGATATALPPGGVADPLAADETALFCIGAHMSGLALNGQLTELGGRFLRTAMTLPDYRMYAIGERPGLVRADGGGVIEGEVWALPTSAIGVLLARVPAPLGFGEVLLQDGPCLGFLAEAAGVAGAEEITSFGGWRAWRG